MAIYNYVLTTGLIVPDVSNIVEDINNEYKAIFGDDFVVDPATTDGVFISSEATSRESVARNNAAVSNQINPNFAGGIFLDAIWALTGGNRSPATRSTVECELSGIAGTSIPSGSLATTSDNIDFRLIATTSIGLSGSISAEFESVEFGPQAAPENTLTKIVSVVLGWETITNPLAATLGVNIESDVDSRRRRKETIGLQGRGLAQSVISNIRNIANVKSVAFRENFTDATEVIDGITLVPHSIWVAAQGGTDQEVAQAILDAKGGGANFNGAVSVNIIEPYSGQSIDVLFDRPISIAIRCRVTIKSGSSSPVDPIIAVRNSIIKYVNGDIPDEDGFIIGTNVSPFEFSGAINLDNPELFVNLIEVSYLSPINYVSSTLPIATNEVATLIDEDIEVIII